MNHENIRDADETRAYWDGHREGWDAALNQHSRALAEPTRPYRTPRWRLLTFTAAYHLVWAVVGLVDVTTVVARHAAVAVCRMTGLPAGRVLGDSAWYWKHGR